MEQRFERLPHGVLLSVSVARNGPQMQFEITTTDEEEMSSNQNFGVI